MPLIFGAGPQVNNPVGAVIACYNAKQPGAQGMNWSFGSLGGVTQANRKYTNTLRVITNSPFVGPLQIQQFVLGTGAVQGATYRFPLPEVNPPPTTGPACPTIPTETDAGSFCNEIDFQQDSEDACLWLVTLKYSSWDVAHELGTSQAQNGAINPTEMAPEVNWSFAKYEVSNTQDINGNPFINTAGDPLENPPKVEETRQVLSFVRNEQNYNDNYAQQFRDHVNSDIFLGWPPNMVKCKSILGQRVYTADWGYYWKVSYEFEFRVGTLLNYAEEWVFDQPVTSGNFTGWDAVVLNAGLRQLVGGTGTPQQITIDGSLITSPVPLQQNGAYTPLTAGTDETGSVDPWYIEFTLYPSAPFAQLNIPQDLLTESQ
jgi:hypothetical protein